MSDFAQYEMVSKSPDWTGVPGQKLVKYLAGKAGVPEEAAKHIAFVFMQWTLDNQGDGLKAQWEAE